MLDIKTLKLRELQLSEKFDDLYKERERNDRELNQVAKELSIVQDDITVYEGNLNS